MIASVIVVVLVLQLRLALVEVIEQRRLGVDSFVSVVDNAAAKFGVNSGAGFRPRFGKLNLRFKFGLNFGLTLGVHYADHALVCHSRRPFEPDPRQNWSMTSTAMRVNTCCCNSRTEGTLPPTRP